MPKNLRGEPPVGRYARRRHPGDEIKGPGLSDLTIPAGKESSDELGPALVEIDSLKAQEVRRFTRAHLSEHIRQMEDLADRFRMAGRLTSQLKTLGMLCAHAIKTGDRFRRLGAYYQSLDTMRLRVKKWGEHPENAEQRNAWRELEQRILALMLDLAERVDIKRRTLNKKTGGQPGIGRVVDPEAPLSVSAPVGEAPAAEETPEPEERNYDQMTDAELAELIPEEDR